MVDIPGSHWWDEFWWNDRTWRGHLRLKVRHDAPDDEIYPESEEFRFTRKHRKWEHYAYYHYDEWFMEEDPNEVKGINKYPEILNLIVVLYLSKQLYTNTI